MIKRKIAYWIAGTSTAFAGVYIVRIFSAQAAGNNKTALMLAGYCLAIAGLFIITLGTRRKQKE